MQALGLIETKGLLAAIEAADTMVKSADVSIIEKTYVGGGLVTVSITGDVGAVKASIEAGVAAVTKLDEEFLVSQHVIPRPHEELKCIIGPNNLEDEQVSDEETANEDKVDNIEDTEKAEVVEEEKDIEETEETVEKNQDSLDSSKIHKVNLENLRKDDVDKLVEKSGIEKTISMLSKLKVVKLRNLAREYKDFVITGRAISKADKNLLIAKFKLYYEKK
ncbi:BMC domain-containing protein [Clostridium sp. A1-XYC3]|uniref:BMC domain-containing protein n=1 Tax=Clostridium tanneri TaxID=3037988 RepID=A0ABU4JP65_9CLOT|nr:BMC domain-containing protein [Clostridium sp. A1-XYC3]MDW8799948.1 BMC domain-containing protein [Clostridium sp. A1-XYC3]